MPCALERSYFFFFLDFFLIFLISSSLHVHRNGPRLKRRSVPPPRRASASWSSSWRRSARVSPACRCDRSPRARQPSCQPRCRCGAVPRIWPAGQRPEALCHRSWRLVMQSSGRSSTPLQTNASGVVDAVPPPPTATHHPCCKLQPLLAAVNCRASSTLSVVQELADYEAEQRANAEARSQALSQQLEAQRGELGELQVRPPPPRPPPPHTHHTPPPHAQHTHTHTLRVACAPADHCSGGLQWRRGRQGLLLTELAFPVPDLGSWGRGLPVHLCALAQPHTPALPCAPSHACCSAGQRRAPSSRPRLTPATSSWCSSCRPSGHASQTCRRVPLLAAHGCCSKRKCHACWGCGRRSGLGQGAA